MMGSGFRIGRFFGIDLYIQASWIPIFLLVVYLLTVELGSVTGTDTWSLGARIAIAVISAALLFGSVVAHEYGHALMAKWYGIETERISLFLFGGVAQLRNEPKRPIEEFLVALAGPAVSFVLAVLAGGFTLANNLAGGPEILTIVLGYVAGVNLSLVLFNLLPGFPMDGGRVLRAILWAATGNFLSATRWASYGGRLVGAGLIAFGVLMVVFQNFSGIWMGLIGFFIWRLAAMSFEQAIMSSVFHNTRAIDLMRPVEAVIPADATVGEAVERVFSRLRADMVPVVRGDRVVGWVDGRFEDLERRQWDWVRVSERANTYEADHVVRPGDSGFSAFLAVVHSPLDRVAVFDDRRLLGHICQRDLIEFIRLRREQLLRGA